MTQSPDNAPRISPAPPVLPDTTTIKASSKVPIPKAHEPTNIKKEFKATVLTGSTLIDTAIMFLKNTFIGKIFNQLFPVEKPSSISLQDAHFKILTDASFAKKFGAALTLYLTREEKLNLFHELNRLQKNFSDEEKTNLKAFIQSYISHSDANEIEFMESQPRIPAFFNNALGKAASSDTVMERYGHLTSTVSGKHPLSPELDQIRRGAHLNRDEFIELMASSITKNGQAALSKIRGGELAELARTDITENPDKFSSLSIVLINSGKLMEAIKGDILQDSEPAGIKNSLEFYIDLADQLASRGDANGFIIILAVILDPEMDSILQNAALSAKHLELLNKLESKAESIDSTGNFKDNPGLPSGLLLVDRIKEAIKGKPLDRVSEEIMGPLSQAMDRLENLPETKNPATYNIESFIKNHPASPNASDVASRLESDLNQIYSVLEKAQSDQKLRFTPEGLVAKERSIFSRFTSKLAGKKDPAKNAVQYVLAKIDRALDQNPPPLEKIGHILNFLNSHTWSKIVLNKNDNLNKILDQLEQKYLSKIDKSKAAEKLHNQTYNGLKMIQSFLKDIDDTRHLKGISGAFNVRSSRDEVSEEALQNFYTLLKNAENDPELKPLAKEVIESLFKTSWFEAALDKHKALGDNIIQMSRVMVRQWVSPEELK